VISVFYDGKCGLCRREIAHYIRIAPEGVFAWVDITVTPEPFNAHGYAVADGLKALHVRDDAGIMHVGVDAFIAIWLQLPRWHILAWIVRLPIIRPVAQRLYAAFGAWRFKKLGYAACDI
jgi:predicted DCC family thiol-disulfide oxidoreductase YuxK